MQNHGGKMQSSLWVKAIKMRLILITNLYPPQELGGYGRCMADFAWGLQQRGHRVQVISSDAPYLGPGGRAKW